ncbi:MAG TPA: hypothetical protein VLG12_02850 [Candidatus Saccharimonadales bacterium]|nr:hypothetical protein [Candidatus Saccharimonadales bacterium]
MKRFIYSFIFIFACIITIFSLYSFFPPYAQGATTCQDSGQACGTGTGNCCASSSNGKPLWCKPDRSGGAGTCTEDTAGVTCQNEGSPCALNSRCCSVNPAGQGLTCDATTSKCVTATAGKTCIAANDSCTITDQCCSTTANPLSCVDSSGKPIFTGTGSCKAATNTNAGAVVSTAPPPPPCASTITKDGCSSVNTAFGVWNTEPAQFVQSLFSILLSISGGIAILIIIIAGYTMITSQGDPEKVQGAREQITAAIIGLLFLIFSVVILEIIGVDILHLPGFSHSGGTATGSTGTNTGDTATASTSNTALDTTACDNIALDPNCGLNNGGSGLFCGNHGGSAGNCSIGGRAGVLYRCTKTATGFTSIVAQVCPNQDCQQNNGAQNADSCGTGAVKHYACQSNGLCQEDPNGTYTTGNCNNACN